MGPVESKTFENIKSMKDTPDKFFISGRRVRVIRNEEYVKYVQSNNNGWDNDMIKCLNHVYEVKGIDHDKGIILKCSNKRDWLFNRAALEPLESDLEEHNQCLAETKSIKAECISDKNEKKHKSAWGKILKSSLLSSSKKKMNYSYKVGDIVQLSSEEAKFEKLQPKVGGYSKHKMRLILGQCVSIKFIAPHYVKVNWKDEDFDIHPDLIVKDIDNDEEILTNSKSSFADNKNEEKILKSCSNSNFADFENNEILFTSDKSSLPDSFEFPSNQSNDLPILPYDKNSKVFESGRSKDESLEKKVMNDPNEMTQFFEIIEKGDTWNFYKYINLNLINMKGENGMTPINYACCLGKFEIVKELLSFDLDLDICDDDGLLPIHNAVKYNHEDILKHFLQLKHNAIKSLTSNGKSLLHLAVIGNHKNIIKILIDANVNPYLLDNDDKTAFQYITDSTPSEINDIIQKSPEINRRIPEKIINKETPIMIPEVSIITEKTEIEISKNECEICKDRIKNVAFYDCGHTACSECAEQIKNCHMCKASIIKIMKIFL